MVVRDSDVSWVVTDDFPASFPFHVSTDIIDPGRVNVACGQAEERVLLTGLHAVADIYCESCKTPLGWKYVSTY